MVLSDGHGAEKLKQNICIDLQEISIDFYGLQLTEPSAEAPASAATCATWVGIHRFH